MVVSPAIDWSAQVRLDRAVDPYLVWAELSGWADLPAPSDGLPLIVEGAGDGSDLDDKGRHRECPSLEPHPAYVERADDGAARLSRVYTARLPRRDLESLLAAHSVKRFQLCLPRWTDWSPAAPQADGPPPRCLVDKGLSVVGVIDDGCPFAHPALREAPRGRSRVVALWEPGRAGPVQAPWAAMAGWAGAQLRPSSLAPSLCDSRQVYASVGHAALADRASSHGSGVSHLAAGSTLLAGPAGADSAAPLVFVQLPAQVIADTSGGAVGALLLDALQYLRRVGLPASAADGGRLVVNISYGSLAGPHDGSSLLETGIADVLEREPRLQVVVAAGNGHRSQTHARWCPRPAEPQELAWMAGPDHPLGSFLELWLPPGADLAQVELSLRSPAGGELQLRGAGCAVLRDAQGRPQAGLVASCRVSQGLEGTMVLAALRPTRAKPGRGAAPHGLWRLRVTCGDAACVGELHAWVERNDLLVGQRRRQQSWLVDDGRGAVQASHDLGTLAHLDGGPVSGAGPRFHVVGATRLHDGRVSDYSASGPARGAGGRTGPDGVAPGDAGTALRGLLVHAAQEGRHARISGTSAAAALLTRHLAAHGSLQPQPGDRPAAADGPERGGHWQVLADGRLVGALPPP